MRYERTKIVRDQMTVYNRAVPPWELPVLEFIFEPGNVQPQGSFEKVTFDYPSGGEEFDRLMRAYGGDPQSGVSHVAAVYGNAGAGIRALQAAIDAARTADEAAEATVKVAAPKATKKRKVEIETDPLVA